MEGAAPEGASAPIPSSEQIVLAGAPKGARLQGRLVNEVEETFGRLLYGHEVDRFADLVEQVGQPKVYASLATYREGLAAGTVAPVSIARWLRQGGLVEVSHVA